MHVCNVHSSGDGAGRGRRVGGCNLPTCSRGWHRSQKHTCSGDDPSLCIYMIHLPCLLLRQDGGGHFFDDDDDDDDDEHGDDDHEDDEHGENESELANVLAPRSDVSCHTNTSQLAPKGSTFWALCHKMHIPKSAVYKVRWQASWRGCWRCRARCWRSRGISCWRRCRIGWGLCRKVGGCTGRCVGRRSCHKYAHNRKSVERSLK